MTEIIKKYNSDLLKGTGLIQETLFLLDIYKPGILKHKFIEQVIESNVLVKNNNNRIKDIIEHVFYRRYVNYNEDSVVALKYLREKHFGLEILNQLLLVYTCRKNLILFDFITEVYQKLIRKGLTTLPQNAARDFVDESIKNGNIEKTWADSTKKKVAEHINACLIDFKLTDRKKNFLSLFLSDTVFNFLVHELHFRGFSDEAIVAADEWKIFGYDRYDVITQLERLAIQGHFIFQNSGELVKITWNYKNMKELIDGIRY
jgi:hypothetical protein